MRGAIGDRVQLLYVALQGWRKKKDLRNAHRKHVETIGFHDTNIGGDKDLGKVIFAVKR